MMEKFRQEEVDLIRAALETYKNRVDKYKEHMIKKYLLHQSLFVDLDKREEKIESLLNQLPERLDRIMKSKKTSGEAEQSLEDCQLLDTILDVYQRALLKTKETIGKIFRDVEPKELARKNEEIIAIRDILQKLKSRS